MKAANLILTSLVASLAWAHPKNSLGFFAKVNGALRPLVGTYSRVDGVEIEILSYGDAYPSPTNFFLQGRYAVTGNKHDPAYLGSYDGMLGFGNKIPKTKLKFDAESKVLDVRFHSCKLISNLLYEIFVGEIDVPGAECSEVEIYFLPYDRRTGAAVTHQQNADATKKDEIESEENEDSWDFPEFPMFVSSVLRNLANSSSALGSALNRKK